MGGLNTRIGQTTFECARTEYVPKRKLSARDVCDILHLHDIQQILDSGGPAGFHCCSAHNCFTRAVDFSVISAQALNLNRFLKNVSPCLFPPFQLHGHIFSYQCSSLHTANTLGKFSQAKYVWAHACVQYMRLV